MLIWDEETRPSIGFIKNYLDKNLDQHYINNFNIKKQYSNDYDIDQKKSIN